MRSSMGRLGELRLPSIWNTQIDRLQQSNLARIGRVLRTPYEFWRGYEYGRAMSPVSGAGYDAPGKCSLEEYFDGVTAGPGVWKWRHYFPIYERHFSKFQGKEVHILEVGVYSGGSLKMWHAYFGDKVTVYGVDLYPECRAYEDDRTRIFVGDQADPNFWQEVIRQVPSVDIVIDDGGHQPHQQIATLEALLPHLRPGGVYMCEDLYGRANLFHSYVGGLARNLHDVELNRTDMGDHTRVTNGLQRSIASIHQYPFVTVIEARSEQAQEFSAPKHGTEWQPIWLS